MPRPGPSTDVAEHSAGGALDTVAWTHDPRMLAAHGFPPAVQAKGNPAAQAPPKRQPAQDAEPEPADTGRD